MRSNSPLILFVAALAMMMLATDTLAASKEKVLYNFKNNGKDGYYPLAGLTFNALGDLYGTTTGGGAHGAGAVFELMPKAGGGWIEKVLHSFEATSKDGIGPTGSLIFDADGDLYGTTGSGGAHSGGTVFELMPKAGGGWTEKILHSFGSGREGFNPVAGLIFDSSGNLYGTTTSGGVNDSSYGTVFELTPKTGGGWTEKVLHSFIPTRGDGKYPSGALVFDTFGNLYGTTSAGGTDKCGCGTVFELTPQTDGTWTETILHSFNDNGTDGNSPDSGLTLDAAGNIYGTTPVGGSGTCVMEGTYNGCGTVFELNRQSRWTETILHSFSNNGKDGTFPDASLLVDAAQHLYGTTAYGGRGTCPIPNVPIGCGTVFELTLQAGGKWTETDLHSFNHNGKDGNYPAGLIFGVSGNLYGTTFRGGTSDTECASYSCGTVFEIKP
jgi:uncharacterized repeat protein (TIGR03803 family)